MDNRDYALERCKKAIELLKEPTEWVKGLKRRLIPLSMNKIETRGTIISLNKVLLEMYSDLSILRSRCNRNDTNMETNKEKAEKIKSREQFNDMALVFGVNLKIIMMTVDTLGITTKESLVDLKTAQSMLYRSSVSPDGYSALYYVIGELLKKQEKARITTITRMFISRYIEEKSNRRIEADSKIIREYVYSIADRLIQEGIEAKVK